MSDTSQLIQVQPLSDGNDVGQRTYRNLAKRFIADVDDARGYAAFGLFLYEYLDRIDSDLKQNVINELSELDDTTITVVYYAAAHRLIQNQVDPLVEKKIDAQSRSDRLYMLLSRYNDSMVDGLKSIISDKLGQIEADIKTIDQKQDFPRQIAVTFMATALVAAIAVLLVLSPDIIHVLRDIFTRLNGG